MTDDVENLLAGSIEMKNGYPVYNDMLISELDNSDPAS